jgi:undecaprenyl-diphosphatase
MFFAMIFNTLLKRFFQIPLFPHLGIGYAFPSGHMHTIAMFFGFILPVAKDKRIKALLSAIILFEIYTLMHSNFHDLADIVGALGCAAIEILCYYQLVSEFGEKKGRKYALVIAITLSLFSVVLLPLINYTMPDYVWSALYSLLGIATALFFIVDSEQLRSTLVQKFMALSTMTILTFVVYRIFQIANFEQHYLSEMKFLLPPLILYSSIKFFSEDEQRPKKEL